MKCYWPCKGASINDVRARGGEGVVEEWTRVLISCVIMYVTRGGEGVKKFEIFMDVIDGSPLTQKDLFS